MLRQLDCLTCILCFRPIKLEFQYNNQNAYIKSRFLYSTLVFIPLLGAVSSPYLFLLISITTKQHMIVIGARTSVNWGSCYSIFSFKYNVL